MTSLRGRWAQGLEPRNFTWIIRDRMAAAERLGPLRAAVTDLVAED